MEEGPELDYDRHEKAIYAELDGERTKLISDASRKEFANYEKINKLVTRSWALSDHLLDTVEHRNQLIEENKYLNRLYDYQQSAAEYYGECIEFQSIAEATSSEIISSQLNLLYKLEKFLKHYFRQISIAQSLGFSERLLFDFLPNRDYVLLYGFVRNTCSTMEYLGKLLESRRGDGVLGLGDKSVTFRQVYEEIKNQGLDQTFVGEQEVPIPPQNEYMRMDELTLSDREAEYLWEKRNDIVHHCPVVVGDETSEQLPDDIVTTAVLDQSDITVLTKLASRLHLQANGMFLKYSYSYATEFVEPLVNAWYHDETD